MVPQDLIKSNSQHSQALIKAHFNVKAKRITFEEGDRVLAFLKVPDSTLQPNYPGPYNIIKKVNDTTYVIIKTLVSPFN